MELGGVIDNMRFEKVTFDRFCGNGFVKLWWVCRVLVVLLLVSWSPALFPAVLDFSGGFYVEFFSSYEFNPHLVFLFGNSIIALLFVLCRQSDALNLSAGGDFYDHYVSFSEAAQEREPVLPPPSDNMVEELSDDGDDEKQIVVRAAEAEAVSESDDVAAAIETAVRQIERFQRTQSEKMKSHISARPRPVLRRSETTTESCRKTGSSSGPVVDVAEIETLSGEDFRRIVDSFIDIHWRKTTTKQNQVEEHDNYRLLKMA